MPLDPLHLSEQARRGIVRRALLVGSVQAAAWIGVAFVAAQIGALSEKILKDFRAELPSISKTALRINHVLYDFWYLLLPVLLVLPLLHYAVASWTQRRSKTTLHCVWYVATWLAPALVLIFFLLAYLLPLLSLFSNLQGH
jgi:hypothetical protein